MQRLTLIMRIQTIAFLGYALGWLLVPDLVNDGIFGWDTETFWARGLGAVFLAVAYGEWQVIGKLEERLDLVWMYAVIPIGILVALLWERLAGTFNGTDLFFWVSVGVTVVFGTAVAAARVTVEPDMVRV